MTVYTGTVTSFDPLTGKGSITPDLGGDEVLVNKSACEGVQLSPGRRVEFEKVQGPDGINARNIRVIG